MSTPPDSSDVRRAPSVAEAIGGPVGMVESALPAVVFVVAVTVSDDTTVSSVIAVAVALVLAGLRLVRGQTIRYAVGGLLGVAFSAFIAARTGKAENFFLPGLLLNAGYAAAFIGSIVARRPALGYAAMVFHGAEIRAPWHRDPVFRRAASRATWVLALVFLARLAVQLPLYAADSLVALGFARVAMGLPLFALGVWVAWLLLRAVPVPTPESETDPA